MASRQAANVFRVAGGNKCSSKLQRRRDNEGINRIDRRHSRLSEQSASLLCDLARKLQYRNPPIVQEVVHGGIEARALTDLRKNRRWYADEGAPIMREGQDRKGPILENTTPR